MGKRFPSAANLQDCARAASERIKSTRLAKPLLKPLASPKESVPSSASASGAPGMEAAERRDRRLPLSEVVSDCARRWFQDTLKEARAGDAAMQVLVGQMYQSGYGIARNEQKAKAWITKASRYRSSVWKVSDKRPGYNASDSDSDEVKDDMK